MPKWITAFIVASTAFALIPFAIAAKARNSKSSEPHIHIFPDMDFQPKYKSDVAMDLFPDDRANRGDIPGTVARGNYQADDLFFRGLENGASGRPASRRPTRTAVRSTVDADLLDRGQNRFNIYCTPCHGYDGRGQGMVPSASRRAAAFGSHVTSSRRRTRTARAASSSRCRTASSSTRSRMATTR